MKYLYTYWAFRVNDRKGFPFSKGPFLIGVWYWPDLNPIKRNGTMLFKTRAQARTMAKEKGLKGKAVKVRISLVPEEPRS